MLILPFLLAGLCSIHDSSKIDCHIDGQHPCEAAGCCWQPQPSAAIPWCFRRKPTPCALSAAEKPSPSPDIVLGMRRNIDIQGKGGILASPDTKVPGGGTYVFHWMRDAALAMRTMNDTAKDYFLWVDHAQRAPPVHPGVDVLTEPKFNLPNGGVFAGPWCRPQTDGPALRATTVMLLGGEWSIVTKDLDWVAEHGLGTPSCDLWEEIRAQSLFWNVVAFSVGLQMGAQQATVLGDVARAQRYQEVRVQMDKEIMRHVAKGVFFETKTSDRLLDSSVLGAIFYAAKLYDHGVRLPFGDASNVLVARSMLQQQVYFCNEYPINQGTDRPGVLIGRYVGDTYGGGNPWVLSSAQFAGVLYEAARALNRTNTVDHETLMAWNLLLDESLQAHDAASLSHSLWLAGNGQLEGLLQVLRPYGLSTLSEQIDRDNGMPKSAFNLTWSYGAILDAIDSSHPL